MTIEIHRPELEAFIRERMNGGSQAGEKGIHRFSRRTPL